MPKISFTSTIVLCAALAACTDGGPSAATAPDAAPALSEAAADAGVAYTIDGAADGDLAIASSLALPAGAQEAPAQLAAAAKAANGGRSSGHVGFPSPGVPAFGIAFQKYSYTSLHTDVATDAAKGQFEVHYTTTAGNDVKIHGNVVCMNIFGNNARVGGQITKLWRNGVAAPITTATHAIWVVVDNGEGAQSPPDLVSLMRFGPAAAAQTFCATGFLSFVYPAQEGNVQVQP